MHWHADAYPCFSPDAMNWLLKREGKESELPSVFEHLNGDQLWAINKGDSPAGMLFSR